MANQRIRRTLEPFLVGPPNPNGDYDARCPLHNDKTRSARINFEKNVWICYAGCGKGNLAGLVKRMGQSGPSDSQRVKQPEGGSGGKKPLKAAPINPLLVDRWHEELMKNDAAMDKLWALRGITEHTMRRHQLGWDQAGQAYSIPIFLEDGRLFNIRMYRPDAPSDKKIFWHRKKNPNETVPLYLADVLKQKEWVVVCEGEMDALLANQHGIPAVTGTAGSSTWEVEWSEAFQGKHVFIAYDRDTAGSRGARMVAEHLEPYAADIRLVTIPLKHDGADVSDYLNRGHDGEDFKRVLMKGKLYQKKDSDPMKMEPVPVSVLNSFDSQNVGRAQDMDVLVAARIPEPYTLPKVVESTCTMDAGAKCKLCPMLRLKGKKRFVVSPGSRELLGMMGSSDTAKNEFLRKIIGAVKCDRLQHFEEQHQTVEQLYVRPSWDENTGDFTPRRINSIGKHDTKPSQVVHVTGTTWSDPNRQKNEFLAWDVSGAEDAIDEFRVTPDIVAELRQFRPMGAQSPLQKLGNIARDMERHVTRIYGRIEFHMLVDLVFMSLMEFPFQGDIERRGWLDVLVVGDTRTGKSHVAQRLLEHFGVGQFVNCEAATFAGVIGGVQKMADERWVVSWGIVPMSDRRLVVLDEVSGLKPDDIAKMSDVRSRGLIKMQKIQAEETRARTRLLWLSNPRDADMNRFTYGVQSIQPLIGNREDIARFDVAMALRRDDVLVKTIHQDPTNTELKYSSDSYNLRAKWAWSRTAEDVEWDAGVEHDVLTAAEWLGEQYVEDPPLIQSANAHVKVARVAAAIASAVFSTDKTGNRVIIKHEHVVDATKFLHHLYSMDSFGYHRMSDRHQLRVERAEQGKDKALTYLLENRMLIEFLQNAEGVFSRDMLEPMVNVSREEANGIIAKLHNWGLVTQNSHNIKMQPPLHALLREIEEERM